ncbi:tyrosine-type recombinase/integrase [Chitinophaga sp. GCM10012297]|uniref:Tyrosine-type recombinase/integrase n=1 Tax=Chitinophaga chungangae TaxID=2821488 RepID=A0ABS3YHA9_9BACT|nr:tyrosine-type recombinase/integrase [Chitinophaga chungangae]MBO9154077.1 tyrosine-type recombinase/integrase [Chitinophaga chungangae]
MTLEQYLGARHTPGTAASYGREIAIYLSNCPGASSACFADVAAYLGALRQRYRSAATLNRILCSLKAYYAYLVASGQRSDDPARSVYLRDQRSRDVQLQDLFTPQELEVLLQRKERYAALSYRNRVLMSLLVYQGLQPAEIAQIRTTDIDLDAGTIHTAGTATTSARTLPLKPNQVLLFFAYLQDVRPALQKGKATDIFMLGIRGHAMKAADISKHVLRLYGELFAPRRVSAETIRQSVIANLLKAGHPLHLVQKFAGHKYPSSTERYRQSAVITLQSAVAQYHPMQ